nr:Rrf2 family transcriptional regulator [uncultured Ruminococcus sp.]
MDTKFSSAIHMLILISEAQTPMSSEQIAVSVGTNPSYIRKIAGLLKNANIIDSRQGKSGFVLTVAPEELSLWRVYCAVEETEQIHLFDLHRNPNDECIVGRHIQPTLSAMFGDIEATAQREMKEKTLRDCMNDMQTRINQTEGQS